MYIGAIGRPNTRRSSAAFPFDSDSSRRADFEVEIPDATQIHFINDRQVDSGKCGARHLAGDFGHGDVVAVAPSPSIVRRAPPAVLASTIALLHLQWAFVTHENVSRRISGLAANHQVATKGFWPAGLASIRRLLWFFAVLLLFTSLR